MNAKSGLAEETKIDYGAVSNIDLSKIQSESLELGKVALLEGKKQFDGLVAGQTELSYLSKVGGFAMIGAAIFEIIYMTGILHMIIQIYLAIFGAVILSVETQNTFFSQDQYREQLKYWFHFVFTLWGRGAFYLFCASLLISQGFSGWVDMGVGLYMAVVAVVYLMVGWQGTKKLESVVADAQLHEDLFSAYATGGQNGRLTRDDFEKLQQDKRAKWDLSPKEIDAIIMVMDKSHTGTVCLKDFVDYLNPSKKEDAK